MHDEDDDGEEEQHVRATRDRGLSAPLKFTGSMTALETRLPIEFSAHISDDGEVILEIERFARTDGGFKLEREWKRSKREMLHFTIDGLADDGIRFQSDDLFITSWRYNWNKDKGHSYAPSAAVASATFTRPLLEPAPAPVLRLSLKGLQCFPGADAHHRLGRVVMAGQTKLEDSDKLTGHIVVGADAPVQDAAAWRNDADALLDHLRRLMSFASGVTLHGPVTEFFSDDQVVVSCRSQVRQSRPTMRVVHYLNVEPIFTAAVASFEGGRFKPRDLLVALEWFTMPSTYNEVRLFNVMTALENLADAFLTDKEKNTLGAAQFKKLETHLRAEIKKFGADWPAETLDAVLAKVVELKRKPLRAKLKLLFDKWQAPLSDISDEQLEGVIGARNDVVHSGFHESADDGPDLWDRFTVAREVFIRLMLAAIDFRGEYYSLIGGHHPATFPPAPPSAQDADGAADPALG